VTAAANPDRTLDERWVRVANPYSEWGNCNAI
jgi:hypothetical protein